MPPTTGKRPKRAAREVLKDHDDVPDSSPSRPAKKRKKTIPSPPPPAPRPLPKNREEIDMSDEDLLAAIIPHLQLGPNRVQAVEDHSDKHYADRNEGVQAYAKLAGQGWTYYITNLRNVIGRPPEGQSSKYAPDHTPGGSFPDGAVHLDLGPSKMISRHHADLTYNGDTERWHLDVFGRNGVRIDFKTVNKNQTHALSSGEVIEIAGVEMMFVLPIGAVSLHPCKKILLRPGLVDPVAFEEAETEEATATSSAPSSTTQPSRSQNGASHQAIAPAPPNYQRASTPSSNRKAPLLAGKSPYGGNTVLMNSEDVDLSVDSNAHIKPAFSYAQMIAQAIFSTPDEKLNLAGIYAYIQDNYAYYRHQAASGWQNSIRHNLSLNKSYHKVPRSTDEPGKGMKWCVKDEHREAVFKTRFKGGRGGHRGSSQPSSPANPSNRSAKKNSKSPEKSLKSASNSPDNTFADTPQFTPARPRVIPNDGSPLPRHRKSTAGGFGLSDNVNGSPVLSSSYMQDDVPNSYATPAPHRVDVKLAPPSTLQRPSQHMPTSSPAPFWKFADLDRTPGAGLDSSPIKGSADRVPPSSSPPPPVHRSPSARNGILPKPATPAVEAVQEDEERGIDLTKGFQKIGAYHAAASNNILTGPPATPAINGATVNGEAKSIVNGVAPDA